MAVTFWLKLKTEAAETAEGASAHNIAGVVPRFTPGKEFKDQLKSFSFEKK